MRTIRLVLAALCFAAFVGGCGQPTPAPPTAVEVKEFHDAVRDGDDVIVDRLLRARPVLANARNDAGQTPLSVAQQAGNDELVDVLKKHGARE